MYDSWFNRVETQMGITTSAVTLWSLDLNTLITYLTIFVLAGQSGLLIFQYWAKWKSRKKDNGTQD